MPENYVSFRDDKGSVNVSEDVIGVMVSAAISEVEGVSCHSGAISADIAEFLGRKNFTKNVKISTEDGKTVIDVLVMIRYGYSVTTVARKVQAAALAAIEAMTGIKAIINVHITGVTFDKSEIKG